VPALGRALTALVQRHEVFRTTFAAKDGVPTQFIGEAKEVPLEVIELFPDDATDAASVVRELARVPFDLSSDQLLRATLVRTAPEEHVFVLVTHHIVCDGWSRSILQRDLSALYDAERGTATPDLPALPIRFADFAAWQRATVSGPELETHLAYWRTHLAGAESAVELPLDRPRPATPGFAGAKQTVVLPAELLHSLQRMAKAHDVTLYMVLLAAFQALLHRYSGQEDIVVATVVAGRDQAVLEPIVGYFANTLALRTSLGGDPTVAELLGRVRSVQLGASEHAMVPFEMLTSGSDGAPPLATPSVMFVFQNNVPASLRLGGAELRAAGVDAGTAKFDLFLSMGETGTGLRAAMQYRTELFDDETIARMLGHLHTLLSGIADDWDARISELPLLTAAERHQLLVEWNRTTADYSRTATLFTLVAAQAAATPDRIAVTDGEHTITYAELMRRSSYLARALRARGVGPGTFVGVCMERSANMIVALLAALQAGAAYVPLDPDYPEERLAFMLEDTRAAIVLTTSSVVDMLPALPLLAMASGGEGILRLDPGWEETETPPQFDLATADNGSSNLAYVIYTSGSTGRPKGVMIEHRSAVAFVTWAQSVFGADELAGVLASTSICFDLSIFEIFVPLATGGTVIVVANALSAAGLASKVPVTLINTVPSAIAELLRINGIPSTVRTVNLAGEPLVQRVVDALYDVPNVERVYDLYGPSEDTTYSTFTLRTAGGRATIGRPVANTQLYVLDAKQQPVPVGIPGELYIAGDKLARGYLNRPALTAERFVENPFSVDSASRAYRTGDLVRYLRDGRLEYLGRLDNQIKLRGFRIELGEVESTLESDPAVAQAVAVVREIAPGDSRLIAYVVAVPGVELNLGRVRTAARRALPQYMLPSAIVPLEALPLTRNGKIDRKALPVPESVDSFAAVYVAPRTPTEEKVATVWRDVLRRERVGVHDNFFELGGHSLIAMRIMARLQESFGVRLPINAVLEWPTVEQLAEKLDERLASGAGGVAETTIKRASRVATRRPAAPVPGEGGS
jgi:amino acid adenylation domain-containing protein